MEVRSCRSLNALWLRWAPCQELPGVVWTLKGFKWGQQGLLGSSSRVIEASYAVIAAAFETMGPQNLLFVESSSYFLKCLFRILHTWL